MKNITVCCLLIFSILTACATNTNKTLVCWVQLNDLSVRGGSILTIQSGDQFDGIVYGELDPGIWIAGSEYWNRTDKDTKRSVEQTGKLIQMAVVYEGNNIRIYRNGILYSAYEADNVDLLSDDKNFILFGIRHRGVEAFVSAEIEDARIYSAALTIDQINSLKPNESSDIEPYAWWDFEGEEPAEKTGRYLLNLIRQADDAELKNGRLVLR